MKLGVTLAVLVTLMGTGARSLLAAASADSIPMDRWLSIITNIAILGGIVWPWLKGVANLMHRLGKIEERLEKLEQTNELQVKQNQHIIDKTDDVVVPAMQRIERNVSP